MYFESLSVRALKASLMLRGSSVLFLSKSFKIDDENDGVGVAFFSALRSGMRAAYLQHKVDFSPEHVCFAWLCHVLLTKVCLDELALK